MVTVTGAWAPNGTTNQRMRLVLDYTVSAVSGGAVTVSGSVKVEAGYSFTDSSNVFAWSGSLLGSGSSAKSINVATNGSQTIHTFSQSVSVAGQPSSSRTATFSLTGVEYVGSSTKATVSATIAIPAGQLSVPAAPVSPFGATRVSDTIHDLYWTASGTTEAPIHGFHLELETNGAWARLGNPGAAARSWRTQTTKPDSRHRMRVRAYNSAGVSAWATTGYWWTTPAAPTGLTAERTSDTAATLRWTPTARWATHQEVWASKSTDGGETWSAWYLSGLDNLPASTTSTTVGGLEIGADYRFRVRAAISTTSPVLYADSNEAEVPAVAPPAQPTQEAPNGTYPSNGTIPFRWRHNSLDGSPQSAYELRYRLVGDPTWTVLSGGSEQSVDVAAPDPGLYEWQVRTKGQHADFGPWSNVGRWQMAHPPVVTIVHPADGSTRTTNWLTVKWDFIDPQGAMQTAWRAELADVTGGEFLVEQRSGTGRTNAASFRTALVNGHTYRARVWATSGTGLESDAESITILVDFLPPAPPQILAQWDDDRGETSLAVVTGPGVYHLEDGTYVTPAGATHLGDGLYELEGITATEAEPGVYETQLESSAFADAASHAIERSLDGGETWERIVTGLPLFAGHGDWMVPLGRSALYRAVAITDLGVESASEVVAIDTTSGRVWLHNVTGQQRAGLVYDIGLQRGRGHTSEVVQYLGDDYPTAHFGKAKSEQVSVSGRALAEDGYPDLDAMLGQVVWYRDPEGRAWWAVLDNVGTSTDSDMFAAYSFGVRRVMPPVGVSA